MKQFSFIKILAANKALLVIGAFAITAFIVSLATAIRLSDTQSNGAQTTRKAVLRPRITKADEYGNPCPQGYYPQEGTGYCVEFSSNAGTCADPTYYSNHFAECGINTTGFPPATPPPDDGGDGNSSCSWWEWGCIFGW